MTDGLKRGRVLLGRLNQNGPAKAVAFWTLYAIVSLIAGAIYLRIVPSTDQSLFDYLAWLHIHGVPYYKGSFDMTWPGQLVFHELAIRLFGVHPWTTRAGDFIFLQPAVLAIYVFLHRAGLRWAAAAAALTYPIIYVTSGAWVSGHRDMTGMHFLIGAAIFALPAERRSSWPPVIAGLLIGYATMIRPTYLAFAPMLFLVAFPVWKGDDPWFRACLKQALLFGFGLAVPPLAFMSYGIVTGTLQDWYMDSVRFVTDVYSFWTGGQSRWRLVSMAGNFIRLSLRWLLFAGVAGAALWGLFGRGKAAMVLLVAMFGTVCISYVVQNKGFAAHLAGLIPVLLLLGWGGAGSFTLPIDRRPLQSSFAAFLGLLLIAGTSSRLVHAIPAAPDWGRGEVSNPLKLADVTDFADLIRSESSPDDTMIMWSQEYGEYQVNFLSQRRSPTKYTTNVTAFQLIRPDQPRFGEWLEQFERDLDRNPPKFVLVDESIIPPGTGLPAQGKANTAADQIFKRRINRGYALRERRGDWTLLERTAGGL